MILAKKARFRLLTLSTNEILVKLVAGSPNAPSYLVTYISKHFLPEERRHFIWGQHQRQKEKQSFSRRLSMVTAKEQMSWYSGLNKCVAAA